MQSKLTIIVFLTLFSSFSWGKIKLVTGNGYSPYVDEKDPGGGISVILIKRIFQEMGKDIDIEIEPWKRGYINTKRKSYLGTFPYSKNSDRIKEMEYSDPLIEIKEVLFSSKDQKLNLEDIDSFDKVTTCIALGFNPNVGLNPYFEFKKLIKVPSPGLKQCFLSLKHNRIDTLVTGDIIGRQTLKKEGLNFADFKYSKKAIFSKELFFIMAKDHPLKKEILKSFNETLRKLKESGEYDRIIYSN